MKFLYIASLYYAIVCQANQQLFTFHTELNCRGDGIIFKSNQPNLTPEAPRIISTHISYGHIGMWARYTGLNYTGSSYLMGGQEWNVCFNSNGLEEYDKSLRYLGPPDTTTHSISFYEDERFVGQVMTITEPATANITFETKSAMTTGRTRWTVFTGQNFDGIAYCFIPNEGVWDWYSLYYHLFPGMSNVGSIAKGCNGDIDHYIVATASDISTVM